MEIFKRWKKHRKRKGEQEFKRLNTCGICSAINNDFPIQTLRLFYCDATDFKRVHKKCVEDVIKHPEEYDGWQLKLVDRILFGNWIDTDDDWLGKLRNKIERKKFVAKLECVREKVFPSEV